MIKLTYTTICDLCKNTCQMESFDCTNHLTGAFPNPTRMFTYQLQGIVELCDECAAPIVQAKHAVIAEHIKRNFK